MEQNKPKEAFEELKDFIERHKGYKLKASEIKTLQEIFNKYPEVLTYQAEVGMNLGMWACKYKMEPVVFMALDNADASIQQDKNGWNIGMRAAYKGMAKATTKALQNTQARKQKNVLNNTIESLAKENGLSYVVKKSYKSKYFALEELNLIAEELGIG